MDDLNKRLRALSAHEHDDLSIGDEAADALDARDAEVGRLRYLLQMAVNDFDDLVSNSEGVAGLNLNGDIATWSDLSCGGMMEEWTSGLDAARAGLEGSPTPRWQTMESAPRDGTRFLATHEKTGTMAITWHGKVSHVPLYGWCHGEDGEDIDLWSPTHWQPLPPPPEDV